jgi:hypothetical protein
MTTTKTRLPSQFLDADHLGIRLEIMGGLPIWEAHPVVKHQRAVDRIRASIRPRDPGRVGGGDCGCMHLADVYVSFADGSLKRPDISIFCREPEEEVITLISEAVIEVVSRGFEAKDLELAPHFYLAQGVKDVVVFDPYSLLVLHVRRDRVTRAVSPTPIELECGCQCLV